MVCSPFIRTGSNALHLPRYFGARTCRGTLGHPSRPNYFCRGCAHACRPSQRHKLGSTCAATRALQACNSAVVSGAKWEVLGGAPPMASWHFLGTSGAAQTHMPTTQPAVSTPSPSLTSTTPRIAAKVGSGVSECPLGQRRSSGYHGGSVRAIRRSPAAAGGHRRGLQRACCRAIYHCVFYLYKNLGFSRA